MSLDMYILHPYRLNSLVNITHSTLCVTPVIMCQKKKDFNLTKEINSDDKRGQEI